MVPDGKAWPERVVDGQEEHEQECNQDGDVAARAGRDPRGDEAGAERRHDAAGHEDELGLRPVTLHAAPPSSAARARSRSIDSGEK